MEMNYLDLVKMILLEIKRYRENILLLESLLKDMSKKYNLIIDLNNLEMKE